MTLFNDLQAEAVDRLFVAETFFQKSFGDDEKSSLAAVAKGMTFVQLYAVWEYTVTNTVRLALSEVKRQGHRVSDLRPELLGLVLDSHVRSVTDSPRTRQWKCRIEMFSKSCCSDPIDDDAAFPDDKSQFRQDQLNTIWSLFGVTVPIVSRGALLPVINEIVDNRNAIAHGRSRPDEVGRRYTKGDIEGKIVDARDLCTHVISSLETHCSSPPNVLRAVPAVAAP